MLIEIISLRDRESDSIKRLYSFNLQLFTKCIATVVLMLACVFCGEYFIT